MSRRRIITALIVAFGLSIASKTEMASSAVTSAGLLQDSSVLAMVADGRDGTPLLDQLLVRAGALGDYKYDGILEAIKKTKVVKAAGTFFYKAPKQLRVDVTEFGSKTGSVLVKQKDGKIRAKGGPGMWGMTMSLSPDSRLLEMPNGLSAVECDLASLYGRLKNETASGNKLIASESPVKVHSLHTKVLVLESRAAKGSGTQVVDRVFIDPEQKLPLQWDLFEHGKFASRTLFKNYQVNAHWDDSQFKI